MEQTKKSGFGVASIVLGLISICFAFIPIISYLSFILGILAILFSVVALFQRASKGLAIAGLILAIIAVFTAYNMHKKIETAVNEVSSVVNGLTNEITSGLNEISSSLEVDQNSPDKMTLDKFNKIKTGMTYKEVVNIIGSEGTLSTESSYAGQTMRIYGWYASNGISNATISFMNGKVNGKSQIGLE